MLFLGFSSQDDVLPDINDVVYDPNGGQDQILTEEDFGKENLPDPADADSDDLDSALEFIIKQSDKLLKGNDIIIFNQKQQTEILADLIDGLRDQVELLGQELFDALGAEDTEVIEAPEVEELPFIGSPKTLPDFAPVPIESPEPLLLPDGGEALKMPGLDEYIDYLPEDPRENRWNPPLVAIPLEAIGEALAEIKKCVCIDLVETDCCDELLAKLAEIKEKVEDIDDTTEATHDIVNPPVPGTAGVTEFFRPEASSHRVTGLSNIVWVKVNIIQDPSGRKILWGGGAGDDIKYSGLFSFETAAGLTERIPISYDTTMLQAPARCTGFTLTGTTSTTYSVQYYTYVKPEEE